MSFSEQHYLLTDQYNNAQKLKARIQLHIRFGTNTYPWQRWVFDQFKIPLQARVLEIGCGPGELWRRNLERIPEQWEITLSDFSAGMLQEARQNLDNSGRDFTFEVFDVQSIPYEDARFDAVIANHMLYHVPDRARALSEIRRVLKPAGCFYAATNGNNHLREFKDLINSFDPGMETLWPDSSRISFRLENGGNELSQWFTTVKLLRREGALIVTEVEPLVAYVLSMPFANAFDNDKVAQFTTFLEHELAVHGTIHITTDTGLFEAF